MQLNKFTDYALRILMYIAQPRDELYVVNELAENLQVSQNHLVKIVHFMAKQQWIFTSRGKGGGIKINPKVLDIPLGEIVRILQYDPQIINCAEPPCVLRPQCGLKGVLDHALYEFYASLNQHTLAEILAQGKETAHQHRLYIPLTQL